MSSAWYRASGALSGAGRTGKDNGAAIYWATRKLYAGARPRSLFRMYGTPARTHTPPFVRIRLARGWSRKCYLGYQSAVDGACTSNQVTINRGNERRVAAGDTRRAFSRRTWRTNKTLSTIDEIRLLFTRLIWNSNISRQTESWDRRRDIITLNVIYNLWWIDYIVIRNVIN